MSGTSGSRERALLQRAFLTIEDLEKRLARAESARREPIAVVGMGCRVPGGAGPRAFWELLRDGVDVIDEVPADRWDAKAFHGDSADSRGKTRTREGGFIADLDQFDAAFFGISPREADSLDPQQRLLLEVSWEALEHAALSADDLAGSQGGVFMALCSYDYAKMHLTSGDTDRIDAHSILGGALSIASGRLSYFLDWKGPCLTLDTACSSSLVAIHLACQSLREKECDQALAGGAGVILFPDNTIGFSSAGALSPEGRCKTFDAGADGYVRGEGCGVVVLKRLADALDDGDRVLGVLRGSALTQDGRSNGLTAPSGPAQEEVIRQALEAAEVEPAAIDYVEAHGTGTSLGDPVEVLSLASVMGSERSEDRPLLIGSVKTNLGHTEAAAGVLGLIKVLLALEHGEIPPHLHFEQPNPHIPWDELPLRVTTEQTRWPSGEGRRLAGVSSFGFSGTNAHLVVEEAPSRPESAAEEEGAHLLSLSAKSDAGLRALAGRYAEALAEAPEDSSFADICFTAAVGRAHLPSRLAMTATSIPEARQALSEIASGGEAPAVWRGEVEPGSRPRVAFLFTGQGAQGLGMGRGLFESEPVFRQVLERCNEQLAEILDRPLLSVLYPEAGEKSPIGSTAYTQPALFAVEVALAELWRSWGIEPAAVFGHSVGELAAACVAGAFGIEEGLAFAAERGRLMDELSSEGAMAAIFSAPEAVVAAIAEAGGEVEIAAFNGPTSTAIAGSPEAVAGVCKALRGEGIKSRSLAVDRGFHSPLIDPVLPGLERAAAGLSKGSLRCELISNLTGTSVNPEELADPAYWCRQAREPVRFTQAVDTLRADGFTSFLEIGPEPTLLAMARRAWPKDEAAATWLPSLRSGREDRQQMLDSLGAFYVRGYPVRWEEVESGSGRRRADLPTYPWQRKRHWLEIPDDRRFPAARSGVWDQVVAAGARQAEQGPLDLDLPSCARRWELLNELTVTYIVQAFRELGVFTSPDEVQSADTLIEDQGVAPTYRHLLGRWLRLLTDAGFLEIAKGVGSEYVCPQGLPELDPQPLLETAKEAFRHDQGTLDYFERCGSLLARVLRGETSALETLFPGGSWHVAEHLYNQAPQARYMNGVAVAAVEGFLRTRPAGRPLRVLEIGAGTGGTAAAVLPALPAETTRYLYTDVSDFFLARAAEKFAEYPFVTYRRLDLETPPREQDIPTGAWDLVISANCVHAVRDLETAIGHIGELLADDGLLLLYETTEALTWLDITTGLIEGWQLFEDGWRIDTPLISAELWIKALETGGFEAVEALPREGSAAEVMGQHILLARRPEATGTKTSVDSLGALEEEPRSATPDPASEVDSSPAAEPAADLEGQVSTEELRQRLPEVTASEREELLVTFVRQQVIQVLRLDSSQPVSRRHPLLDLGLDSLLAVELRNRLQEALPGPELPATLVFDYPTVEAVAHFLDQRDRGESEEGETSEGSTEPEGEGAADLAQEIDDLSDDEAEARLLELLDEDAVEVGSGGGS